MTARQCSLHKIYSDLNDCFGLFSVMYIQRAPQQIAHAAISPLTPLNALISCSFSILSTQLRSNPAPELTAYNNFDLNVLAVEYFGNFRRLTHVLVLGKRSSSLPASRMLKRGLSCEKPSRGARGVEVTYFRTLRRSESSSSFITFQNSWIVG